MCIWNPGGGLFWPTFNYENKSFEGVSDLEMRMDYFSLPWESCESSIFCFPAQQLSHPNWEANVVCKNIEFAKLFLVYVN